jgi:hypothetical protein
VIIEVDHAVRLWIRHGVGEHPGTHQVTMLRQLPPQADAVEDVVPEDQRNRFVADEVGAQDERLGDALGPRLHHVFQPQPELAPVAQQPLELRLVLGRGDHQDLPDPGHHQRGERIIDHRFVEDRHELLGQRLGDGPEP